MVISTDFILNDILADINQISLLKTSTLKPTYSHAWMRCRSTKSLLFVNKFYGFPTEVFCSAISLSDYFVSCVKVPAKYMTCLYLASFDLAVCKIISANERVLNSYSIPHLLSVCQVRFMEADLIRMKNCIEEKITSVCDGVFPTTYTFLCNLLSLFGQISDLRFSESQMKPLLNYLLENCMTLDHFVEFLPQTLALAVINHQLLTQLPDFATKIRLMIDAVRKYCLIEKNEFSRCSRSVALLIETLSSQPSVTAGNSPRKVSPKTLLWRLSRSTLSQIGTRRQKCRIPPTIPEDRQQPVRDVSNCLLSQRSDIYDGNSRKCALFRRQECKLALHCFNAES